MKRILLCVAVLSLAACETTPSGMLPIPTVTATKPVATVGDKVVISGVRGLILGHNAVQGAIAIVNPLVRSRVLTPAQVDQYEKLINRAEQLRTGAGIAMSIADRAAGLFDIASQLNALAGR